MNGRIGLPNWKSVNWSQLKNVKYRQSYSLLCILRHDSALRNSIVPQFLNISLLCYWEIYHFLWSSKISNESAWYSTYRRLRYQNYLNNIFFNCCILNFFWVSTLRFHHLSRWWNSSLGFSPSIIISSLMRAYRDNPTVK